ncbi:MAG: hypothetical protein V4701_06895 [Pseudomonadota bacterium]
MRRLALIVLAAVAAPGIAAAQTYGQPYYGASPAPYGQPYGGPVSYGHGGYSQGYGSQAYGYQSSGYGDPRAYRPPVRYGYDRGGRYGYSNHRSGEWTRWSSPPGRGYHDVYGYNDDRAPRGVDHGRSQSRDCYCGVGAYLYDR